MTTVIGIDCATKRAKLGLTRGTWTSGRPLQVHEARRGTEDPVETVAAWVTEGDRVLLALDAPLGWPVALKESLKDHGAGELLPGNPSELFRRQTDRFIRETLQKQPLEVGANLIARTAHAALQLLDKLRERTGTAIPLAWSPSFSEPVAAIEVYPAGTLRAHGLSDRGYKGTEEDRARLLAQLAGFLVLQVSETEVCASVDVLDAVICAIAAADFLSGDAIPPSEPRLARSEGWIWVAERRSHAAAPMER